MATLDELLARATQRANELKLPYAGAFTPKEAHEVLALASNARLLDVRTQVEWSFVGRIEGALELEFMHYPGMTPNPNFVDSLKGVVTPDDLLLFLCRTGGRSNAAATAATSAGYGKCYNILEGFEGDLNADGQRNKVNGWRAAGLPWKQA
ncbi:MAG: rhodanese-like domain-containing protein [Rhodocyclaceae bacterium]|nr:rhodanese-like domain-containing protein [Rhodocyclaceae bacterium]MBK6909116.1 rhodanese-like domain-containing protein [Rhodocyclaceae bacterium]